MPDKKRRSNQKKKKKTKKNKQTPSYFQKRKIRWFKSDIAWFRITVLILWTIQVNHSSLYWPDDSLVTPWWLCISTSLPPLPLSLVLTSQDTSLVLSSCARGSNRHFCTAQKKRAQTVFYTGVRCTQFYAHVYRLTSTKHCGVTQRISRVHCQQDSRLFGVVYQKTGKARFWQTINPFPAQ